ncbi:MAG TPA: hypothetical protein VNZ86_17340, partial [Bacteroidia bacterium]|nr:hypothetical protein [Bacteroidia bacterium]
MANTSSGRLLSLALLLISLTSCREKQSPAVIVDYAPASRDTVIHFGKTESLTFHIRDTLSRIYISHHECTECLDAWVDSGKLFIPEKLWQEIRAVKKNKGISYGPNGLDLYLSGEGNKSTELFGDSSNFMDHYNDHFLVTGKAVGIRGEGIVFRVDTY